MITCNFRRMNYYFSMKSNINSRVSGDEYLDFNSGGSGNNFRFPRRGEGSISVISRFHMEHFETRERSDLQEAIPSTSCHVKPLKRADILML